MKKVSQTKQFARDVKRMRSRGKDLEKLRETVKKLAKGESLGPEHRDHPLRGPWRDCRDCHVESDWVLIYSMNIHSIHLERTHSDLFGK